MLSHIFGEIELRAVSGILGPSTACVKKLRKNSLGFHGNFTFKVSITRQILQDNVVKSTIFSLDCKIVTK